MFRFDFRASRLSGKVARIENYSPRWFGVTLKHGFEEKYIERRKRQLSLSGVLASLRFLFAKNRANECYGDVSTSIRKVLYWQTGRISWYIQC
jgi:hypothetical protein